MNGQMSSSGGLPATRGGERKGGQRSTRQKTLSALVKLRTIDDVFARCVFRGATPLVEDVLRTITGYAGLALVDSRTQYDLKRLAGSKSVALDVWAEEDDGSWWDLEFQNCPREDERRVRYYGSAMDVELLDAGRKYGELRGRWVVFVTDYDALGRGEAVYWVWPPRDEMYDDGARVLYVNATYRGDDELGRLMADLCEPDYTKIHNPLLAERVRYYKATESGRKEMCNIMEALLAEERAEGIEKGMAQGMARGMAQGMEKERLEGVRSLMETMCLSAAQALDALRVPEDDRPRILAAL